MILNHSPRKLPECIQRFQCLLVTETRLIYFRSSYKTIKLQDNINTLYFISLKLKRHSLKSTLYIYIYNNIMKETGVLINWLSLREQATTLLLIIQNEQNEEYQTIQPNLNTEPAESAPHCLQYHTAAIPALKLC